MICSCKYSIGSPSSMGNVLLDAGKKGSNRVH